MLASCKHQFAWFHIVIFTGMVWMLKDTSIGLYSMTLNGGRATVWDTGFTTSISRTTWSAFPNSQLCGTRISSLNATTLKPRKMYLVHRIYIYIYASSLSHSYRVYMLWDKWCIYSWRSGIYIYIFLVDILGYNN